jgi:hypothetical protein
LRPIRVAQFVASCGRRRFVLRWAGPAAALMLAMAAAPAQALEAVASQSPPTSESSLAPDEANVAAAPALPPSLEVAPEVPEFHSLRAALQLGTVFLIGSAYYVSTSTETPDWDLNYDWDVFRSKVTGEAFGPDPNQFGTNFIGHPLGGAGYYLSARSNHGSVLQSSAFAFIGSLLWELFGEISSHVSLNDSIVTPLAGIAIGESTYQLGSFFDRSAPSLQNRALGTIVGPFKTFNDWVDGAKPTRVSRGFPEQEQHRFEFSAGFGVRQQAGSSSGSFSESRIRLSERIARFTPFDQPGTHSKWFHDGDASGIDLDLAIGAQGASNLRLDTRAVLAGYSFRNVQSTAAGPRGGGGLIGLGAGFHYALHDYGHSAVGEADRSSAVRPLDVVLEHRARLSEVVIDSYVEAGPSFGGVRSFALDGLADQPQRLPALALLPQVTQLNGYYFGLGGAGLAALGVRWRSLQLRTRLQLQAQSAPNMPGEELRVRLFDMERHTEQALGWAVAGGVTHLWLYAEQRSRVGSVNDASFERTESTLGAAIGGVL